MLNYMQKLNQVLPRNVPTSYSKLEVPPNEIFLTTFDQHLQSSRWTSQEMKAKQKTTQLLYFKLKRYFFKEEALENCFQSLFTFQIQHVLWRLC